MSKVNLFELDMEGKFIYVHQDEFTVYIIFLNEKDSSLYLLQTDKYLEFQNIEKISSEVFSLVESDYFFTKPVKNDISDTVFRGFFYNVEEKLWHKFEIVSGRLSLLPETLETLKTELSAHPQLADYIDTQYMVHKGNIFFVGHNTQTKHDVFCRFNINKEKIEYLQTFYSETRDIVLNSFSVDHKNRQVYVVGHSYKNDVAVPFLQTFFSF